MCIELPVCCHEASFSAKQQQLRQSAERLLNGLLGGLFVAAKRCALNLSSCFCTTLNMRLGNVFEHDLTCSVQYNFWLNCNLTLISVKQYLSE